MNVMVLDWYRKQVERWQDLHPFVRMLVSLGFLGGVYFFVGVPAYQRYLDWQAEEKLKAALLAADDGRADRARELGMAVLESGGARVELYRVLEKVMGELRDGRRAEMARRLMEHGDATREDRLTGFRVVAPVTPMGRLERDWEALGEEARRDPAFVEVMVARLIRDGSLVEAERLFGSVPEGQMSGRLKRQWVEVLTSVGEKADWARVRERLDAGWPEGDLAEMPAWMDLFERVPVGQVVEGELARVKGGLERGAAGGDGRQRVALLRFAHAASGVPGDEEIQRIVGEWKEREPLALAKLLRHFGLNRRVVEEFATGTFPRDGALALQVLGALQREGQWVRVLALLGDRQSLFPKHEWLAQRAVAAAKAGREEASLAAWKAAMAEAELSRSAEYYFAIERIARRWGMEVEADRALLDGVLTGRGALPKFDRLERLLADLVAKGREEVLLQILTLYLRFEPDNVPLVRQYSYYSTVCRQALPEVAVAALEPLVAKRPEDLELRLTLAVAWLCGAEPAKAAEVLKGVKEDPEAMPAGLRAAWLASAVCEGVVPLKDPRVTGFPEDQLMPSERRRFREWIAYKAEQGEES